MVNDLPIKGIATPPDDAAHLQDLVRTLRASLGRCRVIEVGTWLGTSAIAMLEAGASVVHCVDTWEGTDDPGDLLHKYRNGHAAIYKAFAQNVGDRLHNGIEPHVGTSFRWSGSLDLAELIYIDADHRYEAVSEDIRLWTPHVVPGGILCGHDYGQGFEGVTRAVDESGPFTVKGRVWIRQL